MPVLRYSDIIQKQAVAIIGTTGHVSHGKTTLTYQLTGKRTQHRQEEIDKNATIDLGHANFKIFHDPDTGYVCATAPTVDRMSHPETGKQLVLARHYSIADCPGHEKYMSAMVNGSSIMGSAIVMIAANEKVPQPQTYQHLVALSYGGINKYIIVHNKLDLVTREQAVSSLEDVQKLLANKFVAEGAASAPIIPASTIQGHNIDEICRQVCRVSTPTVYKDGPALMNIVRSFNVNKPNTPIESLVGAVAGGTLSTGVLSIGDWVEILPGILVRPGVLQPIVGRVTSLNSETYSLEHAVPGGLVGVGLTVDSGLSTHNSLVGQYLGHIGTLPPVFNRLRGKVKFIQELASDLTLPGVNSKVTIVSNGASSLGRIVSLQRKKMEIQLDKFICNQVGCILALMVSGRLIGTFTLEKGELDRVVIEYPGGTPNDWVPQKFEIIDDLPVIQTASSDDVRERYMQLTEKIQFRTSRIASVKIPPPEVTTKNKITYITNIMVMTERMNWASGNDSINILDTLVEFINNHISASKARIAKNDDKPCLVMTGMYRPQHISDVIGLFMTNFKCPSCNSYRTYITKNVKKYKRTCIDCPVVSNIKSF